MVAIFTEQLLRGEQPVINGDGKQTRDYVFVGDVARANLLALSSDYCGALNIGTGIETDVNRLFALLCAPRGVHEPERHGAGQARRAEPQRARPEPGAARCSAGSRRWRWRRAGQDGCVLSRAADRVRWAGTV